jgi:hypothetical protein
VNEVERRILELARFELGQHKKYIREVRRKVVVPNRRYSWMLFERLTDTDPVETVVLDVNRDQAWEIDRQLAETFKNIVVVCVWENPAYPRDPRDKGIQTAATGARATWLTNGGRRTDGR